VVIDMVEQLGTAELAGGTRKSARGRRAYHPVMLLMLLAYAYCSGVLPARAIRDRCRVDAAFWLACAGLVPGHPAISRFRQRACREDATATEAMDHQLSIRGLTQAAGEFLLAGLCRNLLLLPRLT
jgi:transposase